MFEVIEEPVRFIQTYRTDAVVYTNVSAVLRLFQTTEETWCSDLGGLKNEILSSLAF